MLGTQHEVTSTKTGFLTTTTKQRWYSAHMQTMYGHVPPWLLIWKWLPVQCILGDWYDNKIQSQKFTFDVTTH